MTQLQQQMTQYLLHGQWHGKPQLEQAASELLSWLATEVQFVLVYQFLPEKDVTEIYKKNYVEKTTGA